MSVQLNIIIKYLNNEMSEEERKAFEQQLSADKALAKEVLFQRGLHGFLHRNNPILENKLNDLGNEFIRMPLNHKKTTILNNRKFWLFIIALSCLLLSLFVYFNNQRPKLTPPAKSEIKEKQPHNSAEDTKVEKNQQQIPTKLEPLPTKAAPSTKATKTQPIAKINQGDYQQNPILEALIVDSYREERSVLTIITTPKQEQVFEATPAINFEIAGTTTSLPPYKLVVYSNRTFDIENEHPVLSIPLQGIKNAEGYTFSFKAVLSLKKGLYYYMITGKEKETRALLSIARFRVE